MYELNLHGLSREQYDQIYKDMVERTKVQYLTGDMNYRFGYNNGFTAGVEFVRTQVSSQDQTKQDHALAHLNDENTELRNKITQLQKQLEQQSTGVKPTARPRKVTQPKGEKHDSD